MHLTNRIYILLVAMCCFVFTAQAQDQGKVIHDIGGYVCSKGITVRIADVMVTNRRTKVAATTNDQGIFRIKAALGDTLEYYKQNYTTLRQPVNSLTDIVVFIQQIIQLDQVVIKDQTKKQELNSVMNQYKSQGVYNGGKTSALGAAFHPVNALYDLFGSGPANARRFAAYSKKELEASEDHRKYNKELVKKITELPDDEIQKFMDTFTPSHEDLQKWNDYEVIDYIKKSLVSYKKNGAIPLQKLY